MDLPPLCTTGHTLLIGNLLQHGLLLFFDADVAVPLEVVVRGFPGVAVVPQQRDRRPGAHGDVSHTFLIYILLWRRLSLLCLHQQTLGSGFLIISAVCFHHVPFLCGDDMLLLTGFLPR